MTGKAIREALEPFAKALEEASIGTPDTVSLWFHPSAMGLTVGDLRRARTAYDSIGSGVKALDVDGLAQEIRRVDGRHDLGAGALAEALMPYLSTHTATGAGPVGEAVAWIVASSDGTLFRCWREGMPTWIDDREQATRYARRVDAEAVHCEDEDAWSILPYAARPVEEPGEVERLVEETGSSSVDDLRDMALVGHSLMNAIHHATQDGPFKDWTPAEDPAEIVADLVNALAETRERLEKEAPKWRPIEERDQIVETIQTFGEVTLRNSHPVWVRDADGRVYEAVWTVDGKGRGYWWDTEGESPVDPVAILPHPLTERAALTGDAQKAKAPAGDA